jgi:hypothetical protein
MFIIQAVGLVIKVGSRLLVHLWFYHPKISGTGSPAHEMAAKAHKS